MQMNRYIFILLIPLIASCATNQNEQEDKQELTAEELTADPDDAGLMLPDGFNALVVAEDLGRGRHIAVKENGDIYLMLRKAEDEGSMVALRDTTGDGKADIIKYFGEQSGTGIAIHNNYLYYSSDTSVHRVPLSDALIPEGTHEKVVGGFPDQGQHAAKPLAFDQQGNMFVTIGAPANACQEQIRTKGSPGQDPCPLLEQYGGIWQISADQTNQMIYEDGQRYATGIRHAVAISWNDRANHLYAVQHGRDQLNTLFPEHYDDQDNAELPAEEFIMVNEGDDFGWPYCYYDGLQDQKELAPEYGGDGEKIGRCDQYEDPILAFPAHIAPNDLLFYNQFSQFPEKYHQGAFVAFHGSWNRAPLEQKGYHVGFVPFEGEMPSGDWEIFADGFANSETIESPGQADYRPCGLAIGPDGSLYVADSNEGKIWRIFYGG